LSKQFPEWLDAIKRFSTDATQRHRGAKFFAMNEEKGARPFRVFQKWGNGPLWRDADRSTNLRYIKV